MPLCSNCSAQIFMPRIDQHKPSLTGLICDKLCSESGVPSISQPDKIATLLESVMRHIASCGDEIRYMDVRRALAFLDKQQSFLQDCRDHLQDFLSPIQKLPNEILQCIFDECCVMNYFRVGDRRQSSTQNFRSKPALSISSVSVRWRRNALSLPSIWSRISLEWSYDQSLDYFSVACGKHQPDGQVHEKVLFALDNFLNRSKQYPLSVTMQLKDSPLIFDGSKRRLCPVVSCLMEHAHRWRTFSNNSSRLFRNTFSSLPLLEETVFVQTPGIHDLAVLGGAPKLKSLIFRCHPHNVTGFCLENLSHLELRPLESDLETLFHKFPKLISLKLVVYYSNGGHYRCPENVSLSSVLETLTVVAGHYVKSETLRDNCSVFPFFTLPSLKTIHLQRQKVGSDGNWLNFDHFVAFINRSSFKLSTLHIEGPALSDSNLVLVLILMPTLLDLTLVDTDVSLESSPITRRFIERLRVGDTFPQMLPRLYSLTLSSCSESFDDAVVIAMIQSRWCPYQYKGPVGSERGTDQWPVFAVDCLRECTIRFPNRKESELEYVYSCLKCVEQDGMRLNVSGNNDRARVELA
ncbi:hypothetical protein BDP27DRAFT_1450130 [Rhodocollybia butyracea]|uniref:F-box domain-containing protein n=1 Tax=Rhodocollybia butyracea TaxID=206335 RepID=A0A9P5U4E6_9AGAR|nr:hypothetical protein BDP27DRAFT_1450130 [Rhodocollybia butyracea]